MEIKNIHTHAKWFASYESKQGKALILCQKLKIKQLQDMLKTIAGEIELTEDPKEVSCENVIASIKGLIENVPEVSYTEDYFKWIG